MSSPAATASQDLGVSTDIDSHEMTPTYLWGEVFGPHSAWFAEATESLFLKLPPENCMVQPGLRDTAEITAASVWNAKGPSAPGAFDFDRRVEVLDCMGTSRQLIFPSAALVAFGAMFAGDALLEFFELDNSPETRSKLRSVCDEYNTWALRTTATHGDRLRPVVMLIASGIDDLVSQAAAHLEAGARAFLLPTSTPPAGRSPADHELDPFWSMAEEADVPVLLHIGTEQAFRATDRWAEAPEFQKQKLTSTEITFDPFEATTMYMVPATYLTALVMGGVFERHPRLRFGVVELGASWFGPMAEHLDLWAAEPFRKRMSSILTMPPSEYLARNVRVTPFYFEPVDTYIERWPHLVTSYCFNTDYPHLEGGKGTKERFADRLGRLGADVSRNYFVTNGSWLLPD